MHKPIFDDAIDTLTCLGLNKSQAKVYLTISMNGILTGNEISKYSEVNRQEIYRIMPKLESLGLAQRIIGLPTKWKASSLENGLSILIEEKNNSITEIKKKAKNIIKNIGKNNENKEVFDKNSQFIIIPKKEASTNWIIKTTKKTKETIDIISLESRINQMDSVVANIEEVLARGIKIRILTIILENKQNLIKKNKYSKKFSNLEQRTISGISPIILGIHDQKIAIFSIYPIDVRNSPSLVSTNPYFVNTLQNYFEILWKKTNKIT